MSIRYTKSPVPSNPEDIPAYLQAELDKISAVIGNIADGHFELSNVEPPKPREGDLRYADGTNWNPGQGNNFYYFDGTVWRAYTGGSGAGDFANFGSAVDQTAAAINTAYPITWDLTGPKQGISLNGSDTSKIEFTHAGTYYISYVGTVSSGSASTKTIEIWPRVNGVDIANSGIISTSHENGQKKVIARNGTFTVSAGDYLQAVWAVDDTDLWLEHENASAFAPAVPSSTISILQVSQ
mgnify:FL=1